MYKSFGSNHPLFCVPSSYSSVKETNLIKHRFKGVIYANQLIRAAYPEMEKKTTIKIPKYQRAQEAENNLMRLNRSKPHSRNQVVHNNKFLFE